MVAKPKRDDKAQAAPALGTFRHFYRMPWWFYILIGGWALVVITILTNEEYKRIWEQLREGIALTLYLAISAYIISLIVGLLTGLVRAHPPQPPPRNAKPRRILTHIAHTVLHNVVTLYVEFMRGIPPLVFLLIVGFILLPILRDDIINDLLLPIVGDILNDPEIPELEWRGRDPATAIMGLSLIYGAFLSEVFRAGIQGVDKGQVEAAKSLGMSWYQVMRYVVVPQAVIAMLPPLGNNFIAMIKDTSLVTILGVNEVTQIGRKWSGSTFLYLETFLVVSFIYLTITVSGSMLVKTMERRLQRFRQT